MEYLKEVYELSRKRSIPLHLDGARIFNAAIAAEVSPAEIAAQSDSVMFCLSKGLGAPIGSMLVGTKEFVKKARKGRKIMGGAMRQAGIIAAAGIFALERMIDRLSVDHRNARFLAEGLSTIPGIEVFSERLDINMVFFKLTNKARSRLIVETLLEKGIKINPPEGGEWRFVTNLNVSRDDLERVIIEFERALKVALAG
jgi:threonine aldolase